MNNTTKIVFDYLLTFEFLEGPLLILTLLYSKMTFSADCYSVLICYGHISGTISENKFHCFFFCMKVEQTNHEFIVSNAGSAVCRILD